MKRQRIYGINRYIFMDFYPYSITDLKLDAEETYILRLKPKDGSQVFSFLPGQFCSIKNPRYEKPDEPHMFSIASSPNTRDYLEFCLKVYGNWTHSLVKSKIGDELLIAGPYGRAILDENIHYLVLLIGGVGIVPAMSLLRYVKEEKKDVEIILLYGNRTLATAPYKNEIDDIYQSIKGKVVHILSHLVPEDPWIGYRGFITDEMIKKEVDFSRNPTFYMCGPHVFIQKMTAVLNGLNVEEAKIKKEIF